MSTLARFGSARGTGDLPLAMTAAPPSRLARARTGRSRRNRRATHDGYDTPAGGREDQTGQSGTGLRKGGADGGNGPRDGSKAIHSPPAGQPENIQDEAQKEHRPRPRGWQGPNLGAGSTTTVPVGAAQHRTRIVPVLYRRQAIRLSIPWLFASSENIKGQNHILNENTTRHSPEPRS